LHGQYSSTKVSTSAQIPSPSVSIVQSGKKSTSSIGKIEASSEAFTLVGPAIGTTTGAVKGAGLTGSVTGATTGPAIEGELTGVATGAVTGTGLTGAFSGDVTGAASGVLMGTGFTVAVTGAVTGCESTVGGSLEELVLLLEGNSVGTVGDDVGVLSDGEISGSMNN
jgi:hypothetical protein